MRIALGADHAGVVLKEEIKQHLDSRGLAYEDFGTHTTDSVDYPDVAFGVARQVAAGTFERGVLVCGSGIGMAIAANKVAGVRAAPVVDESSAMLSRAHNDANVLAIGARLTPPATALRLIDVFLETAFEGGRHQRRIDKLASRDEGQR